MEKIFGMILAGALLGAAIYMLAKNNGFDERKTEKKEETKKETYRGSAIEDAFEEMEVEKSAVANTIYDRHEEASKIMKEAVDVILKNEDICANNCSDFEEISDELNELLKEE